MVVEILYTDGVGGGVVANVDPVAGIVGFGSSFHIYRKVYYSVE